MSTNKNNNDWEQLFNKKELDSLDKKFIEIVTTKSIVNHNKNDNNNNNKITNDDFMKIVSKGDQMNQKTIKNKSIEKYLIEDIVSEERNKEKKILELKDKNITMTKRPSFFKLFLLRFTVTVILCLLAIFYLYKFVFMEG